MRGSWVGPTALLLLVLGVDAWVFVEARARRAEGRAVTARVGPVTVSTPEQWLLACLLLWVVAVPLYLVARRSAD